MKKVEVLGTGCKKCTTTEEMIANKADALGLDVDIQHVTDAVEIATRGITSTPAVMVDDKLVHKGGVPKDRDIEGWLKGE